MSQHEVTLLLGSNLGNTEKNINFALVQLQNNVGEIVNKSTILHSQAVEFASTKIFCNIALLIKTHFSPIKLLSLIKIIEFDMGRREDSVVTGCYNDRIIDIDIVKYDNVNFECKKLNIPHYKHLCEREFSRKLLDSINKH
jgi:2-amino-4-hydroxy-6-hydroxymethyldihydropteridine diphosphokinase